MNLYESIKRNIKESEEFYAKCIKNGTDVNTEYFDSQSEAEQFAEKAVKNNDYDEVDVYKTSNDDCVGIYDKSDFNESDSKEERIKWLEDALVSVYSYGIRACVIDNIVPGLTDKDSYASLSDEYKKLTGKDFNIKEHIKNESELKEDEEPKITAYSIAQFEAERLDGKAYDVDDSDSLRSDHAGFTFNFRGRSYKCDVALTERGSATKESELKESYDTWNVIEEAQASIKNLINNLQKNGDTVQTSVVIDALNSILKDIEKNSEEAW